VLWESVGFGFQKDFGMALIFLGDKFFKRLLDFAFTSFHGKFGGQSISSTDPDFIGDVCNDPSFDPGSMF
jgi:hypothetical protein